MSLFVHRLSISWIIIVSTIIGLAAPIIMGVSGIYWIYWAATFPAISLNVVGADSLYIVAKLLISSLFLSDAQGLTGGVFSTMARVGKSVGLAPSTVIIKAVTKASNEADAVEKMAEGY